MSPRSRIPEILSRHQAEVLSDWVREQLEASSGGRVLAREDELREESRRFLALFARGVENGNMADIEAPHWQEARHFLSELSRGRARQGHTPSETARFVFSLKQPIFGRLRRELEHDSEALAREIWAATELLDRLGLFTVETYQKSRDEVISRQQHEMLELSTPVVELWDGVVALPLIGTLDSGRAQVVMETLLERIVETGAQTAILDITGVPTVDTLVAQHLLKTIAAAKLMGAECIISGIRPQIAQTIVQLGVDLGEVTTKASLADAFALALRRGGLSIGKASPKG